MTTSAAASLPKVLKTSVILFPGQGSQYVGMATNLCDRARSLFDIANQVLGYDLLSLCQRGPEEDLNKTVHSQPAMLVSSLAAVENLADRSKAAVEKCIATAGFSVGEFASLVLAQSIDIVDAIRLIKLRAEATQLLSEQVPSGMMTIITGSDGKIGHACAMAREFCVRSGVGRDVSVCSIANHLFPHGKVVGGHQKALEFLEINGKDFGFRRTKRLAVSGAFHTELMRGARDDLHKALKKIKIKEPKIRVYSNVDASVYQSPDQIRRALERHVYMPVKWEQIMHDLYQSSTIDGQLPVTFECGPQNNMTTMLGMVNLPAKKLSYNIEP